MSAGPIPPPPLLWQPLQFMDANNCWPVDAAYALLSYGSATAEAMYVGPGCSADAVVNADGADEGGASAKRRCSRSHAVARSSEVARPPATMKRLDRGDALIRLLPRDSRNPAGARGTRSECCRSPLAAV